MRVELEFSGTEHRGSRPNPQFDVTKPKKPPYQTANVTATGDWAEAVVKAQKFVAQLTIPYAAKLLFQEVGGLFFFKKKCHPIERLAVNGYERRPSTCP